VQINITQQLIKANWHAE